MSDIPGEEVMDKFKPWFPPFRDMPLPAEPMPEMTPREALSVLGAQMVILYDGSSGYGTMADHAWNVLEKLVEECEGR